MIDAAGFRMVELVKRSDLVDHPVWADFQGDVDRTRILSWDVSVDSLDAQLARYDYCGRPPLYPVLDLMCTAEVAHPTVALHVHLPGGASVLGYLIGDFVLGVYAGEEEYCLNSKLPSRSHVELVRLADALGCEVERLATLHYESVTEVGPGGRWRGVFELI